MAEKHLNLGIIGMSEGNGHPYSWAAICNGYDEAEMAKCPFPVIPDYLAEQNWPEAQLKGVTVSHIWTQDSEVSQHIAKASRIPHVVQKMEDLIDQVDGILLARDDAENHVSMAMHFIEAGIPIYIDKPLAFSIHDAQTIFDAQTYENQVYSCSALRFATELIPNDKEKLNLGKISYVEATIPKSWEKYSVHLLEPIIMANPERGALLNIDVRKINGITNAIITWEHLMANVTTYGKHAVPIRISYFGNESSINKEFTQTYSAFKAAIADFVYSVKSGIITIPRNETIEIVGIIEMGINA